MNGSDPAAVSISAMAIDADLDMGATYKIKCNHYAESTAGHGMVPDSGYTGYGAVWGMLGVAN